MLTATHAIAAGYVGEKIGNPVLALLAGIAIHFLLDSIPHYDTTDGGKMTTRQLALLAIDVLAGAYVIFFVLQPDLSYKSPFLWGAFGGVLPDILDCIPFWQKAFRRTKFGGAVHLFHDRIQRVRLSPFPGLLIQVILIMIFSYLYLH